MPKLKVGTQVATTHYSALTGTSYVIGIVGGYDHENDTYRIDWNDGGYDYLCRGELIVIDIDYGSESLEEHIENTHILRDCQRLAIERFFKGDLPMPVNVLDLDAMRKWNQSKLNLKRAKGVVESSFFLLEDGDKFTWDMVLNHEHNTLNVYVFAQYWGD